jgi:hypothetical protein
VSDEKKPSEPDPFAPPPESDAAIALETPPATPHPPSAPAAVLPMQAPAPTGKSEKPGFLRSPPVRVGVAIALGVLVGWLVSMPYSRRAQRHIDDLRTAALVAHAESDPRAPNLDFDAARAAGNAALGTIGLWLLFGAITTGGWLYYTRQR